MLNVFINLLVFNFFTVFPVCHKVVKVFYCVYCQSNLIKPDSNDETDKLSFGVLR